MRRKIKLETNAAQSESKSIAKELAKIIAEKGDELGNAIIELMPLNDVSRMKLAIVAIGLAKAVAALKDIAKETGISIDKLYETELEFFLREFEKNTEDNRSYNHEENF